MINATSTMRITKQSETALFGRKSWLRETWKEFEKTEMMKIRNKSWYSFYLFLLTLHIVYLWLLWPVIKSPAVHSQSNLSFGKNSVDHYQDYNFEIFTSADFRSIYYSVKSRSIVTILYGYKCQLGEGVRGEFNFVFDIEIVFVVRRRTGTGGGGLGSCEELAVAMVWQSSGRGPVPGPGHCPAAITLPRPGPVSQCGSPGDTGDSEVTQGRCHTVSQPHGHNTSHSDRDQTASCHTILIDLKMLA